MKKHILFLCLFLLSIVPTVIHGSTYDITSYQIEAKISENYNIDIEETYQIYANQSVQSFVRNLEYEQKIPNQENTHSTRVQHIKVGSYIPIVFATKTGKTIKINPNLNEHESTKITFQYQRNLGKIIRNQSDQLFLYLVDGTMKDTIPEVQFTIKLPTNIKQTQVQFYRNNQETNLVTYQIKNNMLYGTFHTSLEKNQTLALSIDFPYQYFENKTINIDLLYYGTILFPLLGFLYAIYVWIRYQRKNKIPKQQSFFPPNQFDPAELSFLYYGKTKKSDFISLILVLANQGYIRIIHSNNTFHIEKIKNYNGSNVIQKILCDSIFQDKDNITHLELKSYLDSHEQELKDKIDTREHRKRIFEKNYKFSSTILFLFVLIGSIITVGVPIWIVFDQWILVLLSVLLLWTGLLLAYTRKRKKFKKFLGFTFILIVSSFGEYALYPNMIHMLIFSFNILLLIGIRYSYHDLSPRTRYGNQMVGLIGGFRNTLYYMNVSKIKEMEQDLMTYFYQMIPYAYVFGFYDKWIMSGYQIITELPKWYNSDQTDSLKTFRQTLQRFLLEIENDYQKE